MGSRGSKEAATDWAPRRDRTVRHYGARVFRCACFGMPQASMDHGSEKEGFSSKNIGRREKVRKQQKESTGGRYSSQLQLNSVSVSVSDNITQMDDDAPENSSNAFLESNLNSANQASATNAKFHSCFVPSGNNSKFGLGEIVDPDPNGCSHLVCGCNSTPFSDSVADVVDVPNTNKVIGAATSVETAANKLDSDECQFSSGNAVAIGSLERKPSQRRQEPLEGIVRFSRTNSVGRLRDRVRRRTSFPEGRFGFLFTEDSSAYRHQDSRRRLLDALANISYIDSESSNTEVVSQDNQISLNSNSENSNTQLAEASGSMVEQRRRIRSQVQALHRLGSRFETIPGLDRQSILSCQHIIGNCTCGTSSRSRNQPSQTSTRASISRIFMLAEALFKVLDEIHQQAVVLASRPSTASIGSVPAPKEVVDRIPVKTYVKSHKRRNDETAQCYICLVEYEEGDNMRMLPCFHEFHRSCIDKWLKEIHRVCPLCRYDVCLSDGFHLDGLE